MTDDQPPRPFVAYEKVPAISWKGAPIGAKLTGTVLDPPTVVHGRDFQTGQLRYWPDGNKRWSAVVKMELPGGDVQALWIDIPSALNTAIAEALEGQDMAAGGTLTVTITGEKVNPDKPQLNPQRQFSAQYSAPAGEAWSSAGDSNGTPTWTQANTVAPQQDSPSNGSAPAWSQDTNTVAAQQNSEPPGQVQWSDAQIAAAKRAGINLPQL